MITRVKRFFRSRGVRKLLANRLALVALAIIALYVSVAVAITLFGVIDVDATAERVGTDTYPAFFLEQEPEKRFKDADFWLSAVDRGLTRHSDPERQQQSLNDIHFAERHVAKVSLAELTERVDTAWTYFEELEEYEDLNADIAENPEILTILDQLEEAVAALYQPLSGLEKFRYQTRLVLGTDRAGRSISIRATYSIKVAIQVGMITSLISVAIGALLGAAAGFFGGWIDNLVIWLYSTFSSIPNLVLLTVLAYMFTGTRFDGTLVPVYVAFCSTFWIGPCRVIRGETLKLKELEYVQAATSIGFHRLTILVKHIIPNTSHLMFINFSLLFIGAIKSEVILTFLGLGVKDGASWGIMIAYSGQEVVNGHFWQIGAATVFMFGLVLAFNILSDALQDAFDPKHV